MSRHIGLERPLGAAPRRAARARTRADVLHGHGAKGGAYARLCARRPRSASTPRTAAACTTAARSPAGMIYLTLERVLRRRTELFLFESRYGRDAFAAKVGAPRGLVRVVHNGVTAEEFAEVAPDTDATDIVFIGELRMLKGVDVLLDALALLHATGAASAPPSSATGRRPGVSRAGGAAWAWSSARFLGPMPAREAFALGRLLVVPSRAESLPYIVLEAAAAAVPMITTNVGGIPEIFGPQAARLVPPGDAAALARAIAAALERPGRAA